MKILRLLPLLIAPFAFTACQSSTTATTTPAQWATIAASTAKNAADVGASLFLANKSNGQYALALQALADALTAYSGTTMTTSDATGVVKTVEAKFPGLISASDESVIASFLSSAFNEGEQLLTTLTGSTLNANASAIVSGVGQGISAAVAAYQASHPTA